MSVYDSDPGPSVLSAVGAVLHISHMTAPNLALPDCTVLTSHRTHEHNIQQSTLCSYGWTSTNTRQREHIVTAATRPLCPRESAFIRRTCPGVKAHTLHLHVCVVQFISSDLCLRLFELLESKPSVAVKVLLDRLSRAK